MGTGLDSRYPYLFASFKVGGSMAKVTFEDQSEFRYSFAAGAEPITTIADGETVVIDTEDAYEGQIREPGDFRDRKTVPRSNPLSGPIYVEGAEPGDTLAVTIREIEPLIGQASTYVPSWWSHLGGTGTRQLMDEFLDVGWEQVSTILPIEGNEVIFDDEISLPYEPMVGTIGTAPAHGVIENGTPGPHGGNMDLTCLSEGSTVLLPVNTSGALLSVGDAHALQGEGEITLVGGEMPATITMDVAVRPGISLELPRIETDEYLYAVAARSGFGTLDDAIRLAYVHLADWLTERGMGKYDAWQLVGLNGRLLLGNISCVAAGFPRNHRS